MNINTNLALQMTEDSYDLGSRSVIRPDYLSTEELAITVSQSIGLAFLVNPEIRTYSFIIDPKAETAYIDGIRQIIALPPYYFDGEALIEKFGVENSNWMWASIALSNGSLVHEALHSVHTDFSIATKEYINELVTIAKNLFNRHDEYKFAAMQFPSVDALQNLVQIYEDLYIESRGITTHLERILEMRANILFQDEAFLELKSSYEELMAMKTGGSGDEELDAKILESRVNLLIFCKNRRLRDSALILLPRGANELIRREIFSNHLAGSLDVRQLSVVRLYAELTRDLNISSYARQLADGSDGKVEGTPAEGAELKGLSKKEAQKIASTFAVEAASVVDAEGEKVDKVIRTKLDNSAFSGVSFIEYYKTPFAVTSFGGDSDKSDHKYTSQVDYSFVSHMRILREQRHVPGEARRSGTKLLSSRLYRCQIDNKVFAPTNFAAQKPLKKTHIKILLDWSGSMADMAEKVLIEAVAMQEALKKIGFFSVIYSHTSNFLDKRIPILVEICSAGPNGFSPNRKASIQKAANISQAENLDGFIIERMSSMFPKDDANKFIFVFSDGVPACGLTYSGKEAAEHTKAAIRKARKSGIGVISFSLTSDVMEANDGIYGSSMNVDCSNPVTRVKSFIRCIEGLQEGGKLA